MNSPCVVMIHIFSCDYIVIDLSSIFVQGRWWLEGFKEAWLYLGVVYCGLLFILLQHEWSRWHNLDKQTPHQTPTTFPSIHPTSGPTKSHWGPITSFTATCIIEQFVLAGFKITRRYYLSVFFNKLRTIAKVNYFDGYLDHVTLWN